MTSSSRSLSQSCLMLDLGIAAGAISCCHKVRAAGKHTFIPIENLNSSDVASLPTWWELRALSAFPVSGCS